MIVSTGILSNKSWLKAESACFSLWAVFTKVKFIVRRLISNTLISLAIISICICAAALPANAQKAACSDEIWDAIDAKAKLEAHYETMYNETVVMKPDSVFEYSCYTKAVAKATSETLPIFSGGNLNKAISTPISKWISKNFSHSYLGGRLNSSYDPCKVMYNVWNVAKCWNFLDDGPNANRDAFWSFDSLDSMDDLRLVPSACNNGPDWTSLRDTAYDDPPWRTDFYSKSSTVYSLVGLKLKPGTCNGPVSKNHVVVKSYPAGSYPDGICTNPGCIYNGSTCVLP